MARRVGLAIYISHSEGALILAWERRYKEWNEEFNRPKADFDLVDSHPLYPFPKPWKQVTMFEWRHEY